MVALPAEDGAPRRFEVKDVLRRTLGVVARYPAEFAWLAVVFVLLPQAALNWGLSTMGIAAMLDAPRTPPILAAVLGLLAVPLCGFVFQGALTYATAAELNGRRTSLGPMLYAGMRYLPKLLPLGLLAGLAVFAGAVLVVVPGLFLATIWSVAAPALMLERLGLVDSLRRSAALSRGRRWPIAGLCLVWFVALYFVPSLLAVAGMKITTPSMPALVMALGPAVCRALGGALLGAFGVVGTTALYAELVASEPAGAADPRAEVFD